MEVKLWGWKEGNAAEEMMVTETVTDGLWLKEDDMGQQAEDTE